MKNTVVLLTMLLLAAAAPAATLTVNCSPTTLAAAEGQLPATHVVQDGDNLHLISTIYFGHARRWQAIWEANRGVIANPNRLEPGTSLTIPK